MPRHLRHDRPLPLRCRHRGPESPRPHPGRRVQGREAPRLAPRGLTRVADLLAAGVPVACGSDNVQDPFVPVGSGDMLEIARWTILAGHLLADAPATAFRMATATPARLMGLGDE